MDKIKADDLREVWLNPPDFDKQSEPEPEYPPFKPRDVKEQLAIWWQLGWDAKRIIKVMTMEQSGDGWFYCMTPSTVERWKRVIIEHDRRLTGGKVLSELGEVLSD